MTTLSLKLLSACCTARHLDDRLHPGAQSCRLLASATPPPAPQTKRTTKDAQLPPCCIFQYPFSAPRPPLLVAAISQAFPRSSASRVPAAPLPATGKPARRLAPRPPPAPTRVSAFTPPVISHPAIFFLPPSFHRSPGGRRRAPRPPSATPPSSASPPPAVSHPAFVGVPPSRRRPPRGNWPPPRPLSAAPRLLACPPPAVGHPAVVRFPPARSRPPRGRCRAPRPPSATPRPLACPLAAVGRPAVFGGPSTRRWRPHWYWSAPCPPSDAPRSLACLSPTIS